MTADACRSIRTLFLSSLLIITVWLLSWPKAVEKLTLYEQTRDLHAWLSLREMLSDRDGAIRNAIYELDPDKVVSEITVEEHDREAFGDTYEVQHAIKARLIWPTVKEVAVTLKPVNDIFESQSPDNTRAYTVASDDSELFAGYLIVFVRDTDAVIPYSSKSEFRIDPTGFRKLHARLGKHSRPVHWDHLALYLAAHGFSGRPTELTSTTPGLTALQAQIDPRVAGDVQVFGLSLSAALFFSSVGVLLAGVSFALLGPCSVLYGYNGTVERTPWIFVKPAGSSRYAKAFDAFLTAILIAWAVTPLLLLFLQYRTPTNFEGLEYWGLLFGSIGLLFSSVIWFLTTATLYRLRRLESKDAA